MKVAALQLNIYPKHPEKAVVQAEIEVRSASKRGPILICLPEHWLLSRVLTSQDPILKRFAKLSKELGVYLNLGANYQKRGNKQWLTSHTLSPSGEVVSREDKVHLYRRENKEASPGSRFNLVEIDGFKVAVLVCHDMVFPETARTVALMGAELLVVPSMITAKGSGPWLTYLRARALENRMPIVSPNVFFPPRLLGQSCVMDLQYDKKEHIMQLIERKARTQDKAVIADLDLRSNQRPRTERLNELLRSTTPRNFALSQRRAQSSGRSRKLLRPPSSPKLMKNP